MKILAANCRGLTRASTNSDIQDILRSENTDILVLSKTLVLEDVLAGKLHAFGFLKFCYVPPIDRAGGLCVAWSQEVNLEPMEMDKKIINYLVRSELGSKSWLLSAIYGRSWASDCPAVWNRFSSIPAKFSLPWLVVGDLNSTLCNSERFGTRVGPGSDRASYPFRNAIGTLGLVELGYSCNPFTWRNGS